MHGFGPVGSEATGINNPGKVVGEANRQAFVYDINTGTFKYLLSPSRDYWSSARDINDSGDIVGIYSPENYVSPTVGFIYDRAGRFRDLNTLIDGSDGWIVQEALGINESGQIVGWARKPTTYPWSGPEHAVLLNP